MQSPGRRGRGCFRRFMQSVTEADRPLDSTTLPELGRNRQGWPLQLKPGDRAAAAGGDCARRGRQLQRHHADLIAATWSRSEISFRGVSLPARGARTEGHPGIKAEIITGQFGWRALEMFDFDFDRRSMILDGVLGCSPSAISSI